MIEQELRRAMMEIAERIKDITHKRMADAPTSKMGDTLVGSKLWDSVDTHTNGVDKISFAIADYYQYVNSGRFWPQGGKGKGKPWLIEGILKWVREKGIKFNGKTETQTAWMITKAIWRNGVKPRPFTNHKYIPVDKVDDAEYVLDYLDAYWDEWADEICDAILSETTEYFNK